MFITPTNFFVYFGIRFVVFVHCIMCSCFMFSVYEMCLCFCISVRFVILVYFQQKKTQHHFNRFHVHLNKRHFRDNYLAKIPHKDKKRLDKKGCQLYNLVDE